MSTQQGSGIDRRELVRRRVREALAKAQKVEGIPPRPAGAPVPLSVGQERLWFLQQRLPGIPLLNICRALPLSGAFRHQAMAQALAVLFERHEALRTAFRQVEGTPFQVPQPAALPALPVVDLSALANPARRQERHRLRFKEAGRSLDLEAGRPFRLSVLRLAGDEHDLLLTVHHLVFDGWSFGILFRELSAAYGGAVRGEAPDLGERPLQFGDFAVWERSTERPPEDLQYWLDHLAGAEPLELPTDAPRRPGICPRAEVREFVVSAELAEALRQRARESSGSLFALLLAAWSLLLSRLAGQRDVVVGTPVANRPRRQLEAVIGCFVNTLALRMSLPEDGTLADVAKQASTVALEGMSRQNVPFARLVQALGPERSQEIAPLFRATLVLQNAPPGELSLPGLRMPGPELVRGTGTDQDLAISFEAEAGGLRAQILYSPDLFHGTTILRLAGRLERLLRTFAEAPGERLSKVSWLSPAERHQILNEWITPPQAPGKLGGRNLLDLFQRQVERQGDRLAVASAAGQEWSYGQLDAAASAIAARLRGHGVGPETVVALCLGHSPELIAGIVGTLKAGGAYLPLDPRSPLDRLRFMVSDSGAAVLLTSADRREELSEAARGIEVLDMAALVAEGQGLAAPASAPALREQHLAYVIYTSGSSGQPKGTLLQHGGAVRLVESYGRDFGLRAEDRCPFVAGPGFDASVWEVWSALAAGASLHVPRVQDLSDLRMLMASFRDQGITHAFLPTPVAEALLELEAEGGSGEALLAGLKLRLAVAGGDRLLRHPTRSFPFALLNVYGPTESTVIATVGMTSPGAPGVPGIGRPVSGTQALVLDPRLKPVATGAFGELCLAGEGLARGYLGKAARTAQSFVPHPWSEAAGQRLYRTGDLVRWTGRGELEIAGRLDAQVKIRGFRVELGEIISQLGALPGVRESMVLLRQDRLVAYVAWEGGQARPKEWLKDRLALQLPSHMVPDLFVEVDRLPLNLNGKVDRRTLAALPLPAATSAEELVAPRDALEQVVAELFSEILGVSPVGAHSDFFALGGHSLLAGRLMARLESALGSQLPLERLFLRPTVAGLAAELGKEISAVQRPAIVLEKVPRDGDLQVSYSQQRLWLVDRLEANPQAYAVPLALRLRGPLRVGTLHAAWQRLVERHEALRTIFPAPDEEPVQRILPAGEVPLPVVDLSGLPAAEGRRQASRLKEAAVGRPLPLATGPLARAVLLRLDKGLGGAPEIHLFVLTLHHIISDAWSLGVLLRELGSVYSALAAGGLPALPPLPAQYADFAAWQRRWLAGETEQRQLEFWKQTLDGLPTLELPGDRPRPPLRDVAGGRYRQELSPQLSAQLKDLGRRQGLTAFMVLLAAFEVFLHRLSGETEFAIGTPVAGRSHGDLEGLVGFFINTLALRAGVSGELTFDQLAAAVRRRTLDALAHQDLPFERIVEELSPRRSLARTPLFQVMFLLQNVPVAPPALRGLEAAIESIETGISKFDLSLASSESREVPGALVFHWVYQKALFDRTTVMRWGRQWRCLIQGLLAEPGAVISRIPLLAAEERHQLLVEWTDPRPSYEAELLAYEQFLVQAERAPEAVALRFEGQSLSYGELEQRSRWLALELRRRGVGAEGIVALFLERSFDMVVALLAVLRAGGVYLPLDPGSPADRTAWVLQDSGAPWIVTDQACAERLAVVTASWENAPQALVLGQETFEDRVEGAGELPTKLHPSSAAYLIYTSGSTGRPKGVVVPRDCLASRLHYAALCDIDAKDAFLHKTALTFDVSVLEILGPLAAGGRVVLARPGGQQDADYLLELMKEERMTQASFPPTLLQVLLDREEFSALSDLHTVVTGGETVPVELPDRFYQRLDARLLNRYGPTETTISVTSWTSRPAWRGGSLPIGRPTAQARIYLLDADLRPVPVGVTAELCIGGPGVTRGYLRRPARTAGSFVPDPFCNQPGARLYRSGDLARLRASGAVQFVGRVDRQVKIRGFRIELGEVEAVLRQYPGVREAAVLDFGDGDGRWLGAYWLCDTGASVSEQQLREHLAARLPDYMRPSGWLCLDTLPLTPSGKVNRQALPAIDRQAFARFEAPQGDDEVRLASLWTELLAVPRVGREDDFFALGGHSLLATRLVSRIRQTFAVHLPLRSLFEAPTVARLAVEIQRVRELVRPEQEAEPVISPSLSPASGALAEDETPAEARLSFAQERLWFMESLQPGTPMYNIASGFAIEGDLSVAFLEAAFASARSRHEVLRTVFPSRGGRPVPRPQPGSAWLPVTDLSGLEPDLGRQEGERLMAAEARRGFNLERGPLLRAWLLRQAWGPSARHRLVITQHHIISDAWSVGLLLADLGFQYSYLTEKPPAKRLPIPVPYSEFVRWQRRVLQGPVLERKLEFWRRRLEGAPPLLELPTDRPRPKLQGPQGGFLSFDLPQSLAENLQTLGGERQATLFMVTLAAYSALLFRLSGQGDVVVGSPVAGRDQRRWEDTLGLFVNALPLRLRLEGGTSFLGHLAQVRQEVLAALEVADLPFEFLVQELKPERSLGHAPVFQALFAVQAEAPARLRLADLSVQQENIPTGTAKVDLSLSLRVGGGTLRGTAEFRRDLFDATTIRRWVGHFQALLTEVCRRPEVPLRDLVLLRPGERHQLTVAWNDTEPRRVPWEALPRVIARRAEKQPEAPALVAGAERWSYRELDERANRWAAFLRLQGVGRESLVAVLLRRSPREVAVLLGILRAGAAYLPLDPAWPHQRMAFVLSDARPALVVSEASLGEPWPSADGNLPPVLDLEAEWPRILDTPTVTGLEEPEKRQLAYVIYTSGSTGQPKGVAVHHEGLANLVRWHRHRLGASSRDRATRLAGPAFDASAWELWPYLAAGSAVHIPPPGIRTSPRALQDWLLEEGITHCFVPTPMAELLLGLPWPAETPVRKFHTAGEALRSYRPPHLPFELFNHYGPTEATVQATASSVPVSSSPRPPAIGRPIDGVRAFVVGKDLRLRTLGSAGELAIAGAGLARGYLRRPGLTACHFVPDPFSPRPGERLYRSGDRVSQRGDGQLDFLGRLDRQVKVRGFRIELGDVEAALRACPGVLEAAVKDFGEAADRWLGAYWQAAPGGASESRLREYATAQLPEPMHPKGWLRLDEFPRTTSGKIDRQALPSMRKGRRVRFEAPQPGVEEALAGLWASLLKVERVGRGDNFFDLGGHSLLATRLLSRIREVYGVQLPLRGLFEGPTLEGLAVQIQAALARAVPPGSAALAGSLDQQAGGISDDEGRDRPPPSRKSFDPPHGEPPGSLSPAPSPSTLQLLSPGDPWQPPLFLVHPVGGTVFCYLELVRVLESARPVYGLQARGLEERLEPYGSFEEMARGYIDDLRTVQAEGPYFLGGWSLGGVIAFEMARQLREAGDAVAPLLLIDSWPVDVRSEEPGFERVRPEESLLRAFLLNLGLRGELPSLAESEVEAEELLQGPFADRIQAAAPHLADFDLPHLYRVFRSNAQAFRRYSAAPSCLDAVLLRAAANSQVLGDLSERWRPLLASLEMHEVEADHFSILQGVAVAQLVAPIRRLLGEVES